MRASRQLHLYSLIFLFLSTFTAAWPWPRWLPELDSLVVRQNNNDNNNNNSSPAPSAAPTQGGSSSSGSNNPRPTGGSTPSPTRDSSSTSGSRGDAPKTTGNISGSGKGNSTASPTKQTVYDPRLPAGGVAMITPAVILGPQYYKVGDFVTFAWNYTSLSATPTAINIMATGAANKQLYTIAANQTVTNSTGAVTWDTGSYQTTALENPLLTQTYTLIIHDADSSISAQASAGYLAVYNQYTFGMYLPQPYVPLNEFKCATCSGALSDLERRALGFAFGMSVITVLSFTWFVGGVGVIW